MPQVGNIYIPSIPKTKAETAMPTTVLNSQGTPILTPPPISAVTALLNSGSQNATVLPEVEITATPLNAFGLTTKATWIIAGVLALALAYYFTKKKG